MKTPIEWDEIPEVAEGLIEMIEDAAVGDDEVQIDGWYESGRNHYGEHGTLTLRIGSRNFQLSAYEV